MLTIRPMSNADTDAILKSFAVQGWHKPRGLFERYLDRQSKGELYTFVAVLDSDIAGYTMLYPKPANGPFAGTDTAEISDFIVFERCQRQGVGNRILDAAERKAAEISRRVSLGVGLHSGYGSAQRIYFKRGYIPDGSGVWFNNAPLEPYADCTNNDELVLYLSKDFGEISV